MVYFLTNRPMGKQ